MEVVKAGKLEHEGKRETFRVSKLFSLSRSHDEEFSRLEFGLRFTPRVFCYFFRTPGHDQPLFDSVTLHGF